MREIILRPERVVWFIRGLLARTTYGRRMPGKRGLSTPETRTGKMRFESRTWDSIVFDIALNLMFLSNSVSISL